jgi:head-tail adaptor
MAKRSGAGSLNSVVVFRKRVDIEDEYGNPVGGGWQDQFETAARLAPRFGGSEGVTAARLEAKQPYNLMVRSELRTRCVETTWQVYDKRGGTNPAGEPRRTFNIKTITNPDERNAYLEMLVVEGEAS